MNKLTTPVAAAALTLCVAGAPASADTHYAFAEPYRQIAAAAGEAGRVAEVHVRRGDRVRQGQILLELDARALEASRRAAKSKAEDRSRVDSLTIELVLLRDRLGKLRELESSGAGSREEVARAEADAQVAALRVEAAEAELQQQRFQLEEIAARIEQRRVRSPVDGVVTDVLYDAGEFVSGVEPHVAAVVQLQQLRVTFYLPQQAAAWLAEGDELPLQFLEHGRRVTGRVEHVGPVTQADSGLVRVDLVVDNPRRQLRSGGRVELELP